MDHSYISFFLFSTGVSLWLICSGACRRRLVIDHNKKEYRFYLHTHLRHRGPLNQIYVRIIAQKTGEIYCHYMSIHIHLNHVSFEIFYLPHFYINQTYNYRCGIFPDYSLVYVPLILEIYLKTNPVSQAQLSAHSLNFF